MNTTLPFLAISMGLLSSFHCLGMCGPIALALPVHGGGKLRQFLGILTYNAGRALTYGLLGMLMGSLAATLSWIGYFRYLSIGAGILMLLYVFFSTRLEGYAQAPAPLQRVISRLKMAMGQMLRKKNPTGWFFLGSLNGLIPCGMVYLALVTSVATGGALEGGTFMLLFGLGTMPMMVGIGFFKQLITPSIRSNMRRLVPVMLTVAGLWLIFRGVAIDYPQGKDGSPPVCHTPSAVLGEE